MRVLVVGGDGKIGAALCTRLLEQGHSVIKTTRRSDPDAPVRRNEEIVNLDLRDPTLPDAAWVGGQIDVVYLIAAITGAINCEQDPRAWLVNAEAPVAMAQQSCARGCHVVFLTSGAPEVAPHTALAMQKSYAGLAVLMLGGCVVRPVPAVSPEKYAEFAGLLVRVGDERRTGLVRWEG